MSGDKPDFIERVAALTGRTTYRVPVEGTSTRPPLTAQDVAAALAMGRRRHRDRTPDWKDIGPEVALAMVCQIRHRKPDVTSAVSNAIMRELKHSGRFYRIRIATNAAYEDLVMMLKIERPAEFPPRLWELYYSVAFGTMLNSATSALERAERAYSAHRAA